MTRKRPAPIANRTAISARSRARARLSRSPANVRARHQQDRQCKDHKDHAEFPVTVF